MPLESTTNNFSQSKFQPSEGGHQEFRMEDNDVLKIMDVNADCQGIRHNNDVGPRMVSKGGEDINIVVQNMIISRFRSSAQSRSGNGMLLSGLEKEALCQDGYLNGV